MSSNKRCYIYKCMAKGLLNRVTLSIVKHMRLHAQIFQAT